jgi:hypothetical protein
MDYSTIFCAESWDPVFLIFTDQAPKLLYYSHIPTSIVAVALSAFVLWKGGSLPAKILAGVSVLFAIWNFIDLVIWTGADSRVIMSLWSTLYLLQALILACTWYFAQVFVGGRDVDFRLKLLMGVLLLPLIVLMPTAWNLSGFDLVNCEAQQGILVKYFYFFQGADLSFLGFRSAI